EDRLADHLPELASLAEQLGRIFEARGFRQLAARGGMASSRPANDLTRGGQSAAARSPSGATSAQLLAGLRSEASPAPSRQSAAGGPLAIPRFEDQATAAGLAEFVQDNGVSPIHQLPEMSSGGVALLDYDGDGWLDVFCVQGGRFPPGPGVASPGD